MLVGVSMGVSGRDVCVCGAVIGVSGNVCCGGDVCVCGAVIGAVFRGIFPFVNRSVISGFLCDALH